MELDQAIEFFSIFGGAEEYLELDFFDDLESIIQFNFVDKYKVLQNIISPSYLIQEPYRSVLIGASTGDGRLSNIFRKARVGEVVGMDIIQELLEIGIISLEESRENSLKLYPKQKLQKSLRSYKIESKVRFNIPFYRFWFGFVEPFIKDLSHHSSQRFFANYEQHFSRLSSLVFEQLSNQLLNQYFDNQLVSMGSYWDKNSEFDILAYTKEGKTILGECKYKNRKICKNELSKLKQKALNSNIKVDKYALFSKSGFSNELLNSNDKNLILFELKDFRSLLI